MSKRMLKEETKVLNHCGITTIYFFLFELKKMPIPPSPLNRNKKWDRGSGELKFKEWGVEGNLYFTLSTFQVLFNMFWPWELLFTQINKFKIKASGE